MMDAATLEAVIDTFQKQDPFRPFTLVMNDGSRLEVDHPKAVHFFRGTGIYHGPGGVFSFLKARSVNRVVEDLASADRAATTGDG